MAVGRSILLAMNRMGTCEGGAVRACVGQPEAACWPLGAQATPLCAAHCGGSALAACTAAPQPRARPPRARTFFRLGWRSMLSSSSLATTLQAGAMCRGAVQGVGRRAGCSGALLYGAAAHGPVARSRPRTRLATGALVQHPAAMPVPMGPTRSTTHSLNLSAESMTKMMDCASR